MAQKRGRAVNVSSAKRKLNELLITWFSLPETEEFILNIIHQHKHQTSLLKNTHELQENFLLTDPEALDILSGSNRQRLQSSSSRLGSTSPPLDHPNRTKQKQILQNSYSNTFPISNKPNSDGIPLSPPHSPKSSSATSPVLYHSKIKVDELDNMRFKVVSSPPSSPRPNAPVPARMSQPPSQVPPPEAQPFSIQNTTNKQSLLSTEKDATSPNYHHPVPPSFIVSHGDPSTSSPPVPTPGNLHSPAVSPAAPKLPALASKDIVLEERPSTSFAIPKFWFPGGKPVPEAEQDKDLKAIAASFRASHQSKYIKPAKPGGIRTFTLGTEWTDFVSKVLKFPSWWATSIFRKLAKTSEVHYKAVKDWWEKEMVGLCAERRLFTFLKSDPTRDYILKKDWEPIIQDLLQSHPGLDFLKQTPEFQEKYAETVVIRIYYTCNRAGNGKLMFKEFCKVVPVLYLLDREDDINSVTQFFSYEHFYVLYCKFWELDTDHDFLLSKDDLLKYNNYSLTETIVNTIFRGIPRKLSNIEKMNYEDFVWFCLCEEDKTTDTSLEYWFRCIDLDDDGILSGYELDFYYAEQRKRMDSILQEQILYEDILCQMIDMINPKDPKNLRLSDIKACPTSGILFNVLFNLNKFIAFEQRDPFQAHAEKQSAEKNDWDRFARIEYDRMAMEAEQNESENGPI